MLELVVINQHNLLGIRQQFETVCPLRWKCGAEGSTGESQQKGPGFGFRNG